MTDRIGPIGRTSPSTNFYLEADLLSQDVNANGSWVRCYLRAVNTGNTTSRYLDAGAQVGSVDYIGEFGRHSGHPFMPTGYGTGAQRWRDGPWDVFVGHNADGSHPGITLRMSLQYASWADFTAGLSLPTIPRMTQPNLSSGSVDAGASVTINTPRASGAFTHTLRYQFGGAAGTIATGVATSRSWTVPLSLLNQIPNAASGSGTIFCDTYNGAQLIGTKSVGITITAGSGVVPDFTTVTHSEAVSAVNTIVGAYVQKQSKLALAITGAAGAYGSTITSYKISVAGQTINAVSGTTPAVIATSGTVVVTGTVTDSRGRSKSKTVNVTVLPWALPAVSSLTVRRCTSGGTVNPDGTYLRVDLNAAVTSLVNGTQKNALTYKVETKPTTGSYATKVTATPGGITFNSNFVVGSGGEFSVGSSYVVQVTVSDKFGNVLRVIAIATAQVPLDVAAVGIGVGKVWEQGALDVAGDQFITGIVLGSQTRMLFPVGSTTARYVRLATVDGLHAEAGGHVALEVFGGGAFGDLDFHSAVVHFVQRGADTAKVEAFRRGSVGVSYFSKQISTYVFELWARFPAYNSPVSLYPRQLWRGTMLVDSASTSSPGSLVEATYFDTGT